MRWSAASAACTPLNTFNNSDNKGRSHATRPTSSGCRGFGRIRADDAGLRRRSGEADHRPTRQLGHRHHSSRRQSRHLQEARHSARDDLHLRQRRDAAAGDFRQRRFRPSGRHARRHGGLFQGRPGAHHRRAGNRRRRLLVRQEPGDQDPQGHQRPHHRLLQQWLLDPKRGARPHQRIQADGQAAGDRQSGLDPDHGDDRSGRCRLGLAAVRPQGDRGRQDPYRRQGHRCRAGARADHPRSGCQYADAG